MKRISDKQSDSFFSLDKNTLKKLLIDTVPAAQAQSIEDLNLGFGFLYYSLARILRPKHTVALGSLKGFSPICFSLGIKDNHNGGKLSFIDAGYSDNIEGKYIASGGEGFWNSKKNISGLLNKFNVASIVTPYITRTSKFAEIFKKNNLPLIDLLYIDADHRYQGFKYDFETFSKLLSKNGVIVFHDVLVDENQNGYKFGVKKYYNKKLKNNPRFETFTMPFWPGICLARKKITIIDYLNPHYLYKKIKSKSKKILKFCYSKRWDIVSICKLFTNIPKNLITNIFYKNKLFVINRLSLTDWQEYKNLRLEALKNSPQAFVDSFQNENQLPDNIWRDRIWETHNKKNG